MSGGDPSGLVTTGPGDGGGGDGGFGDFLNWLFGSLFGGGGGGRPTYKPTAPRPPDPQDDTTQASGQPDWNDPLSEHKGLPRNAPMLGAGSLVSLACLSPDALSALFRGTTSSITPVVLQEYAPVLRNSDGARASSLASAPASRKAEIQQAAQDLVDYQKLTADGKVAEAGAKLDALRVHLNRLAVETSSGN